MEIEWNFESYQDFEQLAKTASKFTAAVECKFTASRVTGFKYSAGQESIASTRVPIGINLLNWISTNVGTAIVGDECR